MGRVQIGREMDIWDGRILWKGKLYIKGRGLWYMTKTSEVIWIYRAFGNLALGRIREFACGRRETLFFAFFREFPVLVQLFLWELRDMGNGTWDTGHGHITSHPIGNSTSRLDPFRLSRFRDRILIL
jgi:hypothetical protein